MAASNKPCKREEHRRERTAMRAARPQRLVGPLAQNAPSLHWPAEGVPQTKSFRHIRTHTFSLDGDWLTLDERRQCSIDLLFLLVRDFLHRHTWSEHRQTLAVLDVFDAGRQVVVLQRIP